MSRLYYLATCTTAQNICILLVHIAQSVGLTTKSNTNDKESDVVTLAVANANKMRMSNSIERIKRGINFLNYRKPFNSHASALTYTYIEPSRTHTRTQQTHNIRSVWTDQ